MSHPQAAAAEVLELVPSLRLAGLQTRADMRWLAPLLPRFSHTLTALRAGGMAWGTLPAELTGMSRLQRLALDGPLKDGGGARMERLAPLAGSLRELHLCGCHLTEVPRVLSRLTNLECLVRPVGRGWCQGGAGHRRPAEASGHASAQPPCAREPPACVLRFSFLASLPLARLLLPCRT